VFVGEFSIIIIIVIIVNVVRKKNVKGREDLRNAFDGVRDISVCISGLF